MMIDCRGLGRSFGSVVAVEDVSFAMAEGEFLAILGPNGAGKSTLLNMLTTLVAPSRGEAQVAGASIATDARRVRAAIGVVFQEPALDERLSAHENLWIHAVLYGIPARVVAAKVAEAIAWADLGSAGERAVRTFSGGMRRRLELARALMHGPRLLILDEPTLGLDPQGRRDLFERIAVCRGNGLSVLMTTHNIQEADACDRVAIMDRGRLVALGTPAELRRRAGMPPAASLEDVFVEVTGRGLRDADASPRERILAFRKRGGELTR
jgi:ABC-2 type transport system ATP-binding protein